MKYAIMLGLCKSGHILYLFFYQESTVDKKFMNTLAWFFFKLLIFEYMEDLETGITFRLPGGYHWKIFVEVTINNMFNMYIL